MAPATQLGIVVLATSSVVLAARGGHAQHHIHKRSSKYQGSHHTGAPFGYGNGTVTALPTGTGRQTRTKTNQLTETIYNTVTVPGQGTGSSPTNVAPVGAQAASTCGGTVTVTDSVTVTVTAGATSSAPVSPESYSTTETTFTARSAIPTVTVPSKVNAAGANTQSAAPATSSSPAAPAAYSSSSAAPAPAPSSSASAAPSAYTAAASSASSASPTSSAAPSSSSSSGGKIQGKRGCLYQDTNDAGCQALAAAGAVYWSTNWAATPGASIDKCTYQPQLWGAGADHTNGFTDAAKQAISNGASAVLGFNEPDRTDQSGLDAKTTAVQLWSQYITPLKSEGVTIVSPGVTSTIGSDGSLTGIQWLQDFQSAGASWDATGVHFYADCSSSNIGLENGGQLSYLQKIVDAAYSTFDNKPVWVTEFGCYDGTPTNQIEALFNAAIPYLEGEAKVAHYAGFKADLLSSGTTAASLNAAGKAYAGQS